MEHKNTERSQVICHWNSWVLSQVNRMHKFFLSAYGIFIKNKWRSLNIVNLSAQLAYRFLLAFIPFIMLLYNFANRIAQGVSTELHNSLRASSLSFLDSFISTAKAGADTPKSSLYLNLIFLFFIIYASLCAVRATMVTMDKLLKPIERRNIFLSWPVAFLYLIIGVVLALLVFLLYLFIQNVFYVLLINLLSIGSFNILRDVLTRLYVGLAILLFLTLIYKYFPSEKISTTEALSGALLATFIFALLYLFYTFVMSDIINAIGLLSILEGTFMMIFFIYALCFVVIFGATIILYMKEDVSLGS